MRSALRRHGAGDDHRGEGSRSRVDPDVGACGGRREGDAPSCPASRELRGAPVRPSGGEAPGHRGAVDGAGASERPGAHRGGREPAGRDAGRQVPAPPAAAPPAPADVGRGDRGEPFEPDQLGGARHRPAAADRGGARSRQLRAGHGRDAGQGRREGAREDAPGMLLADPRRGRRDRVPVRARGPTCCRGVRWRRR